MNKPIFSIEIWTIVFQLCNLLLMFLVLKHFLYQPVKKLFAQREEEVKNTYAKAEEAQTKADALKAEYEQRISAAKEDADEIVRSATKRAQQRTDAMISETKTTVSNMISRAEEQIEAERKKAVNEIKDEIADIALLAAGNAISKDLSDDEHRKLIDDFIGQVGE